MKWNKFRLKTTTEAEDIVSSMLADLGIEGVEIEDKIPLTESDKEQMFVDILPEIEPDDGVAYLSFYLEEEADTEAVLANVKKELEEMSAYVNVGECTIEESETEDVDWVNNWKKYFHQFYVDDILIIPSWEDVKPSDEDKMVIHIDPGTAFGTGMHETTQLCIRQIRKYVTEKTKILDVGCGSGILGMLALTALMRFSQLLLNGGHIPWLLQLIGVLLVIGFVMGLFALAFAPLVLSACRWRDHVLKDEGYLTLTLPVSLHQLLISKLIVSAVWYAAAFIVGLLSLLIAVSGWSTLQYVPDFFNDVFTAFFEMEASLRSHALLIVFELFCNFVFAVSAAELVVYAAFSIGYSFNKHKTLWTTILVLVFFEVAQFTAIAMIGAFFNADPTRWMNLDIHSAPASVELLLLWGMFGELLFAAAGYAVTWYFTTKKLNLE